ncbi:MAG: hypothetical protein O7C73_02645, partial [Nitrospirae bacterium]|nr:hypothetical protein [Nitrospirota bacterium]
FAAPQEPLTDERTRSVSADSIVKGFHILRCEIARVPGLVIDECFGLIVATQRRLLPTLEARQAVGPCSHEGEEGFQARNSSRVPSSQATGLVQALHAKGICAENSAVHEQNRADASRTHPSAEVTHGISPGQRIRGRARFELPDEGTVAGV